MVNGAGAMVKSAPIFEEIAPVRSAARNNLSG